MIVLLLLTIQVSFADMQIRVGVLDTGLNLTDTRFKKYLCMDGHKDFTGKGIQDNHGHGTHIAGLIAEYAKGSNFCLVILKYYDTDGENSMVAYMKALSVLHLLRLDFLNYSGGGNLGDVAEGVLIRDNKEITFVVAAGNDNKNLDVDFFFPASYNFKNIVVVGGLGKDRLKFSSSNYGKLITYWEIAEDVYSTLPNGNYGSLNGTSQATAITTGKLVRNRYVKSH